MLNEDDVKAGIGQLMFNLWDAQKQIREQAEALERCKLGAEDDRPPTS